MYNLSIFIIIYLTNFRICHGDNWHYSMSSMYELFDVEIDHMKMAETYIQNEYKRLDDIRRFIEQRKAQNEKELAEAYTESSINAFKTILRIKTDWETLRDEMAQTTKMEDFKGKSILSYDNIISGLKALRRLQIVYELETHQITDGNIDGYKFEKFDINDCYQMAILCYDNAEFHCAYSWFEQVYTKYKENENPAVEFEYEKLIIDYVWSCYLVGDIDKGMDLLNQYLEHNELTDVLTNMRYVIWSGKDVFKRNTANDPDKKFYSYAFQILDTNGEVENFKTTCHKKKLISRLKCRYYRKGNKFLTIAPLREESISVIPEVKLYHNVLYDSEIKQIKELARPKLERLSNDTNEDITLRKVAKFETDDDRVFKVINQRLEQIASRSKSIVLNKYKVTNYGVSGHYLPHTDYIDEDHLINNKGQEAIVIFHMDDVPKGGATVLPDVHVRVPSIKGSALVVYDTHSLKYSDNGNFMFQYTQYGSCPILYGDKWTLTGWLGEAKTAIDT